jgi:hypothetical protein
MLVAAAIALGSLLAVEPAGDESAIRCGTSLIEVGAAQASVLDKCGEPKSKETRSHKFRNKSFTWVVVVEVWTYAGAGDFPRALVFREGILQRIEVKDP